MAVTSEPILLSVDDAARLAGVGRSILYERLLAGDISSVKIGRRRLVPRAALDAYVERLMAEAEQGHGDEDGG